MRIDLRVRPSLRPANLGGKPHPYTDICLATADLLFIGGGWTGGGERPVSWEQEDLRLFPYSPSTRTNRRRPSSPLSGDDRRRPPPPNAAAAVRPTGDGGSCYVFFVHRTQEDIYYSI